MLKPLQAARGHVSEITVLHVKDIELGDGGEGTWLHTNQTCVAQVEIIQ